MAWPDDLIEQPASHGKAAQEEAGLAVEKKVELGEAAKAALAAGKLELRVRRQGMLQRIEFLVKRLPLGRAVFAVLSTDRAIDVGELQRVADEVGLPVFSGNGKVFPKGKGASDFTGL